ncbi:carbonic anhydrase, partial [Mycena galericulata]
CCQFQKKNEMDNPRRRNVLIIACMDPRVQSYEQLGLEIGACGIVRNAGGSTQDAIRSIVVAQHVFGVEELAVFHHTDCGRIKFTEWLRDSLKKEHPGGEDVAVTIDGMDFHTSIHTEDSLQKDVKFLVENPLVKKITGWVYDVETGKISQMADVVV